MTHRPPRPPLESRLYRLLFRAMPGSYRSAYGDEALADFDELLEPVDGRGRIARLPSVIGAYLDLVIRIPREHWDERAGRHKSTTGGPTGPRHEFRTLGMGEGMMEGLRTLRVAARTLAKRPGFAIVATLTLALGIGANVAVFSIVDAVLLQPLPYDDSGQLVTYEHHAPGLDLPNLNNSEGMIAFYANNAPFIEATAAWGNTAANLSGEGEASRVDVAMVSPEIFDVLRVQPMIGRPFTPADTGPDFRDGAPVVILGHGLWTTRFGADPNVLGRVIEVDGLSSEIIGVMPASFAFPEPGVEIFRVMYVDPDGPFGTFGTSTVSRVAPGITADIARTRLTELHALLPEQLDLETSFLESSGFSVSVETLRDRMVADVESILWIVLGTVGFVFLIACANVANLFLVRAESRQKEMAVRSALGAGGRSVAASFLSESLLLGLAGGVVGVGFAQVGVPLLLSISELPRAEEVAIGAAPLVFAALLSVAAGLLFGTIAMVRFLRGADSAVLRDGSRGSTSGPGRGRARNVLVAAQLALGLVLLVGSGLMLRSFDALRGVELGIEGDQVLTMGLNLDQGSDHTVAARFFQDAADRIATLPGVAEVGVANGIPLASGQSNGGSFFIESQPRQEDALPPVAMYRKVGPGYFTSLGIPIVEGRDVERADADDPRSVVWINETFARTFFDGDPLGERISWNNPGQDVTDGPWAEIVGVVGDVREFGLDEDGLRPNAYFPLVVERAAGTELSAAFLTIRTEEGVDPLSIVDAARTEIRSFAPQVPVTATRTMDDVMDEEMEATSATMIVILVAAVMALFLAAIGLAGVISYVVGQRTREIGVRVALGAHARDVSGMIVRQSLGVTAVGTVLGLIGAFGLTRVMDSLLFGVSSTDPATFVTAPLVLVVVSLLATWWPARRASRVDPIEALRSE